MSENSSNILASAQGPVLLEAGLPLSQSILWDLQKKYYAELGIDAWANNVPFYITSNAFITAAYAQVVVRFLQDCKNKGMLKTDEPLYILEMGAGHGKFAYHFVQVFEDLQKDLGLESVKVCYVMTDFCRPNLDHWKRSPHFQNFFQKGILDFGIFDYEDENPEIHLEISKRVLGPGKLKNPLVVVGNYYFDTIRQDIFRVQDGKLFEGRTVINVPEGQPSPLENTRNLTNVDIRFDFVPVEKTQYPFPELNTVMDEYVEKLKSASIMIPVGGIRCLNNLRSYCDGRILMICGDEGNSMLDDLEGQADPNFRFHGSFSLAVNYHSVARWCELLGGDSFCKPNNSGFTVASFLLGMSLDKLPETQLALTTALASPGPDEFYLFKKFMLDRGAEMDLDLMMTYLKMTRWDAACFWGLKEALMSKVEAATAKQKRTLLSGLDQLAKNFYFVPASSDILLEVGRVYHMLGDYEKAKSFYLQSVKFYGDNWAVNHNLGLTFYFLNDTKKAKYYFKRALGLNAEAKDSSDWLNFLKNPEGAAENSAESSE